MGFPLTLLSCYHMARVSVPTFAEGMYKRVDRATINQRVRQFSDRIIASARAHVEVIGAKRLDEEQTYIVMSNHQSMFDIPILFSTVPVPTLRMVTKSELFRVPVWGKAMLAAEMIRIDRGNHAAALRTLREAGDRTRDGVSIWIAPEGTRSPTGAIGPFKKGGFHLARATGTPIAPVAINGTRNMMAVGQIGTNFDVSVTVEYGDPILSAGRDIGELMDEVRRFMVERVDGNQTLSPG